MMTRPGCNGSGEVRTAKLSNWSGEPPDHARGPRAVPGQNIATENLAQSVLIFFNAIAVLPPLRDFWKSFPEHGRMLAS